MLLLSILRRQKSHKLTELMGSSFSIRIVCHFLLQQKMATVIVTRNVMV